MEKICVFCGRSLGWREKKSLYCGNGTQTVCKDCYEKYAPMTNVERGLLAWETGRAESREELREFVKQVEKDREERQNFTFQSRSSGKPHGWADTKFLGKSCVSGCHLDKIYL